MIDTQAVRAGEDGVPFDTPLGAGAADLRRLVLGAADGSLPNVKLLPRQTFDGTAVDVVDVTVAIFKTRLYIDPTDGAIRGWDEALSTAPNGQLMMSVRVTQREVVPLSATSAALFTLGAPATATVYQPLDAYPHPTVAQAVALSGSQARSWPATPTASVCGTSSFRASPSGPSSTISMKPIRAISGRSTRKFSTYRSGVGPRQREITG